MARQLLDEIAAGATADRFAADLVLPFAALAAGESIFRVRSVTEHVMTGLWLASLFLDVQAQWQAGRVVVHGRGRLPACRTAE
ncbi:MAG: RNA 3'-terminal phosphate cyclase [Pseudonocardiaceae bacterium]